MRARHGGLRFRVWTAEPNEPGRRHAEPAPSTAGAPKGVAASPAGPLTPAGVYLHYSVEEVRKKGLKLKATLTTLLSDPLLTNVLQGVAVGEDWSRIETSAPTECASLLTCTQYTVGFDWKALDDVFDVVKSMPTKTVQLIITPGMNSPQWVMDELASCNNLFHRTLPPRPPTPNPGPTPYASSLPGTAAKDCGFADFTNFPEEQRAEGTELPMPWNAEYQEAWWYFLRALNDHIKGNNQFVAIAVAGPVAASDEFILPTTLNGSKTAFPTEDGFPADSGWWELIVNAFPDKGYNYAQSDQVFIDAWQRAIEKYQSTFSGLTLFIGPDAANDLPTFESTEAKAHKDDGVLFEQDCSQAVINEKNYKLSCEAKTEIITLFLASTGPNQKATQIGGMTAATSNDTGNISLAGVKLLTVANPPNWTAAIGGAEFDHAVSLPNDGVGCLKGDAGCKQNAEPAAANVLYTFFDKTSAGPHYTNTNGIKGKSENFTINYLEVPLDDVIYMQKNRCTSLTTGYSSLVQQLWQANYDLLVMAGRTPPPPLNCP